MSPYWGTLCTPPHTSLPFYIRGESYRECHRDDVHCGHIPPHIHPPIQGGIIGGMVTGHDSDYGISHNVYTPTWPSTPYG